MDTKITYSLLSSLLILGLSASFFGGCAKSSYGTDGCSVNQPKPVADYGPGEGKTDVSFIAFGDTQIGGGAEDKNDIQIDAINKFTEVLSWADAGHPELGSINDIRGIIMAGDITQNGRDGRGFEEDEYGGFSQRYGLCANKKVKYHMFEGYGNHDFYQWTNITYADGDHPVADSVAVRNGYRSGMTHKAPGMDGHYSWDWDNIHFVQLNLTPSDVDPKYPEGYTGLRSPRNALTFFEEDLERHVQGTNKKVIFISHYGPIQTFEWSQGQINTLCKVVKKYPDNIVGYIHGHSHGTLKYDWCNISVYNVGSPYYLDYNRDGRGRFTVFRIKESDDGSVQLVAADVSWSPDAWKADKRGDLDLKMKSWQLYPFTETLTTAPLL